MRLTILAAAAALSAAASLPAQNFATHACTDTHEDHSFIAWVVNASEQVCELRSTTFPLAAGHLAVDSQNGGIEVIGEERHDIALEARVTARARSTSEANDILHEISIATGPTVEAHGPRTYGRTNWSVSYTLHVPYRLAAELHSLNGSIRVSAVNGVIHGETTNGSLHLENLAGEVRLSTTNGSIHAQLDGPTWQGSGLSASTTNGSVHVSLPSHYSAHLVASTTNGGMHLDVPTASQSSPRRHFIDTNIGSGGATLNFETINGGISIQ